MRKLPRAARGLATPPESRKRLRKCVPLGANWAWQPVAVNVPPSRLGGRGDETRSWRIWQRTWTNFSGQQFLKGQLSLQPPALRGASTTSNIAPEPDTLRWSHGSTVMPAWRAQVCGQVHGQPFKAASLLAFKTMPIDWAERAMHGLSTSWLVFSTRWRQQREVKGDPFNDGLLDIDVQLALVSPHNR